MAQLFQLLNCGAQSPHAAEFAPDRNFQFGKTYLDVFPFTSGNTSQDDISATYELKAYREFLAVFCSEAFGTQSDLSGNSNVSLHGG
jgi:hypothetical protein